MLYFQIAAVRGASRSERGAGMAEYALLLILVAIACIIGFGLLGGSLNTEITEVSVEIDGLR